MKKHFLIALLVVTAMVNCRGRETAVTGGYGDAVVAGEVVMGESVALRSPAGVEVSVVGTGMAMTVGEDGRFMFTSVPENAELQFRRASDGIDARLSVTGRTMSVELNGLSAQPKKSSKAKTEQYEGLIRSVDASSIKVFTSKRQTKTVEVVDSTIIRKGSRTYTIDELQVTWRVHVKATVKDGKATAVEILVQNTNGDDDGENDDSKVQQHEGTITEVGTDSIKVFTSKKVVETFKVTATTIIRKGDTTYTLADLKVDWRVHVTATEKDGDLTAVEIKVQNTGGEDESDDDGENENATMTANGKVKSVSGNDLVVQSQPKGDVTVKTDGSTVIKMQGKRIKVSDIKVGWEVNSMGTRVDDHTLLARQIEVRGNSKK